MRLWIDTDVGDNVDDAIALAVAAAHPDIEIAGVSTVGGDLERRADLARTLVPARVPVTAGIDPDRVAAAGPGALLAIGPLTNVAALTAAGRRPHRLVIMGGALAPVGHRGRRVRVEHNFASDPAAAAATLAVPGATIVTLDATVATHLDDVDRLRLAAAAPVLRPLIDEWLDRPARAGVAEADRAVHLHDPAAVLVAAGEDVVRSHETRTLEVQADGRLAETAAGTAHHVVLALDAAAVAGRCISLLRARD